MKTFRSTLLAAAIVAGVPSLVFAQPPMDGGGRPVGPGRFQRGPDAQPGGPAGQSRGQFQPPQPGQDFGGRRDFRGDDGRAQPQPGFQSPQGFNRDRTPDGRRDPRADPGNRPDDRRFDGRPGDDRRFDNRQFGGQFDGRQIDRRQFDNRAPGFDSRFDNGNRFGGGNRFGNDNRFPGGNRFQPDWRNDRRYDWRGYRNDNRQLFRAPRYLPPRGYGFGYRPFARGYQLQPFFYGQNYWISDPWQYRLPPAYGPYRWVRYYNDVVLVDIDTGFVVDVIQNFFW